jgi:hypothetical protein
MGGRGSRSLLICPQKREEPCCRLGFFDLTFCFCVNGLRPASDVAVVVGARVERVDDEVCEADDSPAVDAVEFGEERIILVCWLAGLE